MSDKVVYAITNSINGKMYIGSTGSTLGYRYENHLKLLRRNMHSNILLQEDFNRYGESSFSIKAIGGGTPLPRNEEEYMWIERLRTYDERYGYNALETGVSKIRKRHGLPVPDSPLKGRKYYAQRNTFEYVEEALSPKEIAYCREKLAGKTYKEVGDRFGVSRQYVHQVIKRCIEKSKRANCKGG